MLQIKGGAFAGDTDLLRFTLGDGTVIPGLAEGVAGMKEGGVRQVCTYVPTTLINILKHISLGVLDFYLLAVHADCVNTTVLVSCSDTVRKESVYCSRHC
jgi:FKBP-type peptidyl-prolyl cis-trans isomerase